jgi:myo-inositol-1(or 4)-monophosphatase
VTDARDLVNLATRLAREAGDMVLVGRRHGDLDVETKSSPTDMVTRFDAAAERMIITALRLERPHDTIVGEEGSNIVGDSGIEWFVDPIDGTTNFMYGLGGFAVSIAACDTEGPIAAAVYVPMTRDLFSARRGGGAYLGSSPIRCSTKDDLATSLIATGFSYDASTRSRQGSRVARLLPLVRDIRRMGAAAVDLCHVACGRVDGYFEENLQPWDLAAGLLIATEAGAIASDFAGARVRPEQSLVCAPGIHAALRDAIR